MITSTLLALGLVGLGVGATLAGRNRASSCAPGCCDGCPPDCCRDCDEACCDGCSPDACGPECCDDACGQADTCCA